MTGQENKNNWNSISKNEIQKIRTIIEQLIEKENSRIRQGIERYNNLARLRNQIDYLDNIVSISDREDFQRDRIISISGEYLSNNLGDISGYLGSVALISSEHQFLNDQYHIDFLNKFDNLSISSGSSMYVGGTIEQRICVLDTNLTNNFRENPFTSNELREQILEDLVNELSLFGEKFVNMVKGSEKTLNTETYDHLSQAAHSMRDCFEQIIKQLAPTEIVKDAPWFTPDEGPPDGVSRRSRIRYMLYVHGNNVDFEELNNLDNLSSEAKSLLDLCINRAHNHDPLLTNKEVQISIDATRFILLKILRQYRKYRGY